MESYERLYLALFLGVFIAINISRSFTEFFDPPKPFIAESRQKAVGGNTNHVFIAIPTEGAFDIQDNYTYHRFYVPLLNAGLAEYVGYFGDKPLPHSDLHFPYYYEPHRLDVSAHHMVGKFYSALRQFLFETDSLWLFRFCGDAIINTETFGDVISELNASGDPLKDVIFKGFCIEFQNITYIQGGSGFAISRRAAEIFFERLDAMMIIMRTKHSDDQIYGKFLEEIGVTPWNFSSRWFLGHQFFAYGNASGIIPNVNRMPACPSTFKPVSKCRPFIQRLKDVTVWHEIGKNPFFIYSADKIREKIPDNVFFYNPQCFPQVCIGNQSLQSHYIDN